MSRKHYASDNALDDIDKVNRYVDDLSNSEEFDDLRSERVKTIRLTERPITPPPPVISFQTERKTRPERKDPHKIRRRKSRDRSRSPRRKSSHRKYREDEHTATRKRRRESDDIDLVDCTLSPLERALNRGSATYLSKRRSSNEKYYEDRYSHHRRDRELRRLERTTPTAAPAKSPKDLTLTIIDEGPNYTNLGQMRWRLVESALCMIYLDIMREYPGPPPVCRDGGWFLGCAKLIECADERSLQLYQLALSRIGEVWPGARLKVVNRNEITTSAIRVRCATVVSAEPADKHAILDYIRCSNLDLPTSDWRVMSVGAPSRVTNERHIILSFGIESLPLIEERRGVIKYGLQSITLKINKRDKDLSQSVADNDDWDMPSSSSSRRRRCSGLEETDKTPPQWDANDDDKTPPQWDANDDAITLSDSEEDKDSDYS